MQTYKKGSNAERELMQRLWNAGYAVVRAAGSGVNPLNSPDLIALKKGKKLAIECKARNSTTLSVPSQQMSDLIEWAFRADAELVVAWKYPRKGWFFLGLEDFSRSEKFYSASLKKALEKNASFLEGESTPSI